MKASDLLNEIALIENGWIKIEGPGGTGFMPATTKNEAEWEQRCREMHERQAAEAELLKSTSSPIESATASLRIVRV